MKYIIFIIGLAIIALKGFGIEIDLISIGLFVIISLIVLLKDMNQLSEFSGFGIKMKFNKELKELSKEAESIENKIEIRAEKEKGLSGIVELEKEDNDVNHFEEFSSYIRVPEFKPDFRNPKSSLIQVAIEIEKTLRVISNEVLKHDNKYPVAPKRIINELVAKQYIEKDLLSAFDKFWNLRNKVVHGLDANFEDGQILSLVDSGMKIHNILKSTKNNIEKGLTISILS